MVPQISQPSSGSPAAGQRVQALQSQIEYAKALYSIQWCKRVTAGEPTLSPSARANKELQTKFDLAKNVNVIPPEPNSLTA